MKKIKQTPKNASDLKEFVNRFISLRKGIKDYLPV